MKKIALLAAICGALSSSVALAQLEKGTIGPDIEAKEWLNSDGESVSLQDTRGLITVLYFWVSFHEGGKFFLEDLNGFEGTFGQEEGVRIIGITTGDRKRTEPWIKDHKVFFPVALESETGKEYKIQFAPYMVILDPEGRVVWNGSPASGQDAITAIQEIIGTNPPTRTHPVAAALARKSYSDARKAIQAGRYYDAARAARTAVDKAMIGDPLKTRCQDLVDLLEAVGRDGVAKAEIAVGENRWADAVKELRFVMRNFRGLDVYKLAKERLESYKKDHEEIRKELGDLEGQEKAIAELKRARELIGQRKFGPAFETLEGITEKYDDTTQSDEAERLLKGMREDKRIFREVSEFKASKDCTEWLSSARNYIVNKRYAEARKLLRQVIDTYPESSFADEAVKELVKLP